MGRLNHIPADRTEIEFEGKRYLVLGDGRVFVWRNNRWGSPWWVELWGEKMIRTVSALIEQHQPTSTQNKTAV